MNKSTQIILGVVAVLVIGGGIVAASLFNTDTNNKDKAKIVDKKTEIVSTNETTSTLDSADKEKSVINNDIETDIALENENKEPTTVNATTNSNETSTSTIVASKAEGSYTSNSKELVAKAETTPTVLFFHASWCPTCRATDKDINANMDDLKKSGVQILKVDYDSSTDLKKQYGVTSQHTFVKVDSEGKQLAKTTGLATLNDVTEFAQK